MRLKRRDLPPVLLLGLLILLIILTLSQILIVHNGRYDNSKSIHKVLKIQRELQKLEASLDEILSKDVPSLKTFRDRLQCRVNARRATELFQEAQEYSQFLADGVSSKITVRWKYNGNRSSHSQIENEESGNFETKKKIFQQVQMEFVQKHSFSYCSVVPKNLKGPLNISVNLENAASVSEKVTTGPGGSWRPLNCVARHRVAVIVPYRDRKLHLLTLLSHLHPMLQRQELDYRIFVVEQTGGFVFNKARLMNAGFLEASKRFDFQCFVFHDVDLVPEDDRNLYTCPALPRHLSVAIDEMNYRLAYKELVGGVLNMRREHFEMVNGYSNLYWGWGAEDDDMAYRIMFVGLRITRPSEVVARYKMIKHVKRKPSDWVKRLKLLYTGVRRYHIDGLNSLRYTLVATEEMPLYTHFIVDVGQPEKHL